MTIFLTGQLTFRTQPLFVQKRLTQVNRLSIGLSIPRVSLNFHLPAILRFTVKNISAYVLDQKSGIGIKQKFYFDGFFFDNNNNNICEA